MKKCFDNLVKFLPLPSEIYFFFKFSNKQYPNAMKGYHVQTKSLLYVYISVLTSDTSHVSSSVRKMSETYRKPSKIQKFPFGKNFVELQTILKSTSKTFFLMPKSLGTTFRSCKAYLDCCPTLQVQSTQIEQILLI